MIREFGLPGLEYRPGFLSESEQNLLIALIDGGRWQPLGEGGRRVQQFGLRYDHATRGVTADEVDAIPEWLGAMAVRLSDARIFETTPNQILINEYLPGQGIRPHVDHPEQFGPVVASISLGTIAVMTFTSLASPKRRLDLRLEPGSLVTFSGEARFDWRHGIDAVLFDIVDGVRYQRGRRVSLTFRNATAGG